jgi:hypothetical protein
MENEAGYLVDISGAIDMHSHPAPCLFPRLATDWQIAKAASKAKLGGMLIKCHHESTVSRARALRRDFPELQVFGGIVLNSYVGGINPKAAEAALKMGAKEIWLPTIDAAYHAKVHGSTGKYDVQVAADEKKADLGISAVCEGEITPEAAEVFGLVAQYDAILGTCHQSYDELKIIIPAARKLGVKKILLTHPFFKVPGLNLEQVKDLVSLGAIAEFGYCTVSPMWAYASIPQKSPGGKNPRRRKLRFDVRHGPAQQPHALRSPAHLRSGHVRVRHYRSRNRSDDSAQPRLPARSESG